MFVAIFLPFLGTKPRIKECPTNRGQRMNLIVDPSTGSKGLKERPSP
jgi:hypothetical protein